ncbi:MAG: hypothetical protein A2Y38_25525 [Spirochaetes bacterium GWB1_59_5]|nr:MAG: hypothetical protein A2Y38_25525 [Spirochaetes bacterium GWB1_59_5]
MTTAVSAEDRVQELEVALAVAQTQLRSTTRALEVEQARSTRLQTDLDDSEARWAIVSLFLAQKGCYDRKLAEPETHAIERVGWAAAADARRRLADMLDEHDRKTVKETDSE